MSKTMTLRKIKNRVDYYFQPNPPATEDEVVAFEVKYQVQLPDEYREFITKVCNGGRGYFGSLIPLGDYDYCGFLIPQVAHPFKYSKRLDDQQDKTDLYGLLPFFDEGCGIFHAIAVVGPQRGNVWVNYDESLIPLSENQLSRRGQWQYLTFFQWFLWFDKFVKYVGVDFPGYTSNSA